jgi:outer membrane protein assembly factor BamB
MDLTCPQSGPMKKRKMPMHQNNFKISYRNIVACLCLAITLVTALSGGVWAENWPGWRGPRGDGTSLEKNVPVKWSGTKNVVWKVPIPGKGHASPIIRGDRIFVVTALEKQRLLLCLDRGNGKVLWQRVVLEARLERKHSLNSYASSTPVTDGKKVYVSFLDRDKMFVAAYDFDGKKVWEVRPGVFSSMHGYCSSPVFWKDKVIVNGDHDGPAYIVALDRATGKTIWKTPRPNMTRSEQFVASLVYNGELLFMTSGFPDLFMQGIRPDGRGNVTDTHVVWQKDRDCSYVPSPIAAGPYFLVVSDSGVATCLKAKTGEIAWRQRLGARHSVSLVIANGLVYFLSDKGVMTVVKPGPEFEVVARNDLGEETRASPAISNGQMFLRGVKNLYCIGTASK